MNYESRIMNYGLALVVMLGAFLTPASVLAHVSVKPSQVGVGVYQTFTVGVPNEKDNPTVGLRLVMPPGLEHASPNVKPGWNIETKTAEPSEGEEEGAVTEIIWTGGLIPAHQRDDFLFSAKAPADQGELTWKAYQTYSDGVVVAWELSKDAQPKDPEGKDDFSVSGPYSTTKVVNDLTATPKPAEQGQVMVEAGKANNLPLILSALAVIISGFALGLTLRKG